MTTTTDPFDSRYFDERDLRRELTVAFADALDSGEGATHESWGRAVELATAESGSGDVTALTPAAQDEIVDAWAGSIEADCLVLAEDEQTLRAVALVRRALQVRVRNDGLTRGQWVDRTFAGLHAPLARAIVRSFGTLAGQGSCTCLDVAILPGWQCCGSPWLDNGDIERFIRRARRNVVLLDDALQSGHTASITDPVCLTIVADTYLTYVGGPATQRVVDAYRR